MSRSKCSKRKIITRVIGGKLAVNAHTNISTMSRSTCVALKDNFSFLFLPTKLSKNKKFQPSINIFEVMHRMNWVGTLVDNTARQLRFQNNSLSTNWWSLIYRNKQIMFYCRMKIRYSMTSGPGMVKLPNICLAINTRALKIFYDNICCT